MIEIGEPREEHREQVARVLSVALNFGPSWIEHRAPFLQLDHFRCAFDDGYVVATAAAHRLTQWFGGRELPCSGIYAVATLPEYRGAGLASQTVGTLLDEARGAGMPISTLFPSVLRPYRRLGFEMAGVQLEHEVALSDLPVVSIALDVREYDPGEIGEIRDCYRRAAASANGPIDSDEPDWWAVRVMGHWNTDVVWRAVTCRDDEGVVRGYASYYHDKAEGPLDPAFRVVCKHLVAETPEALRSLVAYFRSFRGMGQALAFYGPPNHPLAMLLPEQRIREKWSYRWMLRLLDVAAALEGRGYPSVSGEVVIAVDDPNVEPNRGPFRVTADDGKVRIERADGGARRPIPIGALASIFSGHLPVDAAVQLGYLDTDDPAVPLLRELFAGPPPWMYDFF
jgi:predicted acetyltransferase